jgi:hypothetical protein
MNKERFANLVERVREAGRIFRDEQQVSPREFFYSPAIEDELLTRYFSHEITESEYVTLRKLLEGGCDD